MTTQFDISALGLTVTEGGVYSFTLTPKAALGSDTVIRWEIVPKGELPISVSDFSALSGVVNFASGDTDAQTVTLTPSDDSVLEVLKHFELRVYEVVGDRDDTSAETDDILIGSQDVTLSDDETDDYGGSLLVSTTEANILTAGNTQDLNLIGAGGDDNYVITRFQHGDIDISDALGANLIKFDAGVTITGYSESSSLVFGFLTVIESVSLTLSTGAVVRITSPAGKFSYQLGDGEALSYADFKTAIGASGTNETSALATDYTITTATAVPDISGNTGSVPTETLVTTIHSDVIGMGGDVDFSAIGAGGDDVYVITRFQHGDIDISDALGANLIKFDVGVSITGYSESSSLVFGFLTVIESVSLTLSTGAVVSITSPGGKFSYQLGDGEVLSYDAFKTAIGASGTNADSALAADYTVTAPQVPTEGPEDTHAPVFVVAGPFFVTPEESYAVNIHGLIFTAKQAPEEGETLSVRMAYGTSTDSVNARFDAGTGVLTISPGGEGLHQSSLERWSGAGTLNAIIAWVNQFTDFTDHFTVELEEGVDGDTVVLDFDGSAGYPYPTDLYTVHNVHRQTYTLVQVDTNPVIQIDENTNADMVVFTAQATDADNIAGQTPTDTITYALVDGAGDNSFFSIDANTGAVRFAATPDYETQSSYEVHVKAVSTSTLGAGSTKETTQQYTVRLNNLSDNDPIVAQEIADQTATEGTAFSFAFDAGVFTDADGDALTYTAALADGTDLPDWLSFDADTRSFSGTPTQSDVGTLSVRVTATDTSGANVTDSFDITVENANPAPTVANAIADQTATEDTAFSLDISGVFADADGDTLTYSVAGASWLTLTGTTLSGTPAQSDTGTHSITITADDGNGGTVTETFTLTVENTDNHGPIFTNAHDFSITVAGIKFTYTGTDIDQVDSFPLNVGYVSNAATSQHDISSYPGSIIALTSYANLTLQDIVDWVNADAAAAVFAGYRDSRTAEQKALIRAELVDPTTGSTALDYDAFFGTRSTGSVIKTFGVSHVITKTFTTWDENSDTADVVFTAMVEDGDNIAGQTPTETITYELVDGAGDNAYFTIDANTGAVRFAATPDYETQVNYTLHIKATSTSSLGAGDTKEAMAQYTVRLNNLNDNAPVVAAAIADQTAAEGSEFSFTFDADAFTDADGDALTYTATLADGTDLPDWLSFDADTRTFSGTPLEGSEGTISVTITASDGTDSVTDTFDIVISAFANNAPIVVQEIADQTTAEGSEFSFTFDAGVFTDADGDTLTYSVAGNPSWLSFNADTRTFSGTPPEGSEGTISVTVTASDGTDSVTDTFDIEIAAPVEQETREVNIHGLVFKTTNEDAVDILFESTSSSSAVYYDTATNRLTVWVWADSSSSNSMTLDEIIRDLNGSFERVYLDSDFTVELADGADGSHKFNFGADDGNPNTIEVTSGSVFTLPAAADAGEAGNTAPTVTETAITVEVGRGETLKLTDLVDDIGWSDPDPDDSVFSYFKIDFGGNHILGGGFYLDGTQQTTAELEALTSGDVEFRAGNKNGAPFTFTLQVGDGGESGTDATDLLPAITVTLDVV